MFRREVITHTRTQKEKGLKCRPTCINTQRAAFKSGESDASKVLKVGLTLASNSNAQELAAWTSVARVVLNLHETITRY